MYSAVIEHLKLHGTWGKFVTSSERRQTTFGRRVPTTSDEAALVGKIGEIQLSFAWLGGVIIANVVGGLVAVTVLVLLDVPFLLPVLVATAVLLPVGMGVARLQARRFVTLAERAPTWDTGG